MAGAQRWPVTGAAESTGRTVRHEETGGGGRSGREGVSAEIATGSGRRLAAIAAAGEVAGRPLRRRLCWEGRATIAAVGEVDARAGDGVAGGGGAGYDRGSGGGVSTALFCRSAMRGGAGYDRGSGGGVAEIL